MPYKFDLTTPPLHPQQAHDVAWLEGYMQCALNADAFAKSDDQRMLAERLFIDALEGQAEACADALSDDFDGRP